MAEIDAIIPDKVRITIARLPEFQEKLNFMTNSSKCV